MREGTDELYPPAGVPRCAVPIPRRKTRVPRRRPLVACSAVKAGTQHARDKVVLNRGTENADRVAYDGKLGVDVEDGLERVARRTSGKGTRTAPTIYLFV